jgi:hypothetical protein
MEITTIGLDLAKSVFQLHAVDADGAVVWRKKVRSAALVETLAQVADNIGASGHHTPHDQAAQMTAPDSSNHQLTSPLAAQGASTDDNTSWGSRQLA